MTLYLHRFTGSLAAGDMFTYAWHANSGRSLALAQLAAVGWNADVWNGASAGNGYKDHVTAGVSMLTVTTVSINPATGKQINRADTNQVIAGVAAGNALPGKTSTIVSTRTELATRAGRGRFHMPQPAVSQVTSTGRVLADLVSDLIDSLVAAWTGYNTATDIPVIYHKALGTTDVITNFDVPDLFGCLTTRDNKVLAARSTAVMP
jgi:hypothetical protein